MAFSTPAAAADFNPADTSVQMFRWKWNDIAKECTNWLGPQGYGAVQVSPPHAAANVGPWWDVYQPVNFTSLNSKMGSEAEFQSMINTCHAAKVRITWTRSSTIWQRARALPRTAIPSAPAP